MYKSRVCRAALAMLISAAVFTVTGGQAVAKDAPKLELKMSMAKEVKTLKDGKEVLETKPADKVGPGDVAVYTITYTNTGAGEARNAVIGDPVPAGTLYVVGSAEGKDAAITFSIDGGKSFHKEPVKQVVKRPDGTSEEKDADPAMYSNIKWVVKRVMPGQSGKVSFKAKVK